jgi:conjugal transfer pilus assembly protein TrbC
MHLPVKDHTMKARFKHAIQQLIIQLLSASTILVIISADASDLTQADLDAARAKVEAARKALEHSGPAAVPIPAAPNLDALPKPATDGAQTSLVDIESLARRFDRQGNFRRQFAGGSNTPHLLAFVSLGMPRASLDRLMEDAERTHTTLVLRGMQSGDMETTLRTVKAVIGKHKVAWFIDPAAFIRFGVVAVPTYVLLKRDAVAKDCGDDQCFSDDDFAKISGDVTIDYVLDQIAAQLPNYRNFVTSLRAGS